MTWHGVLSSLQDLCNVFVCKFRTLFQVDVQGNFLTIRAFRNETREPPVTSEVNTEGNQTEEVKLQPEVYYRSFTQRMLIPDGVKLETIESHFDADTDTLEIRGERDPKAAELRSRSVPIRTSAQGVSGKKTEESEDDV